MTQVTVLTGGVSPERDVAFASATQVVAALRDEGFAVTVVDTATGVLDAAGESMHLTGRVTADPPTTARLDALRSQAAGVRLVDAAAVREADVVFPVLHGREGEGGWLQALLEAADIPFVGSDALGSMLAMAKDVAKELMRDAGIATPPWARWPVAREEAAALGLPLVVKPSRVGSTVGLTLVRQLDDMDAAARTALEYDSDVLVERFVAGRELTVGVLGDEALAVGEIKPQHEIFDYEAKYTAGMTEEIFPASLPPEVTARVRDTARAVHRRLRLRDFSRVDFMLDAEGALWCLEANTLPGLTSASLFPQSAAAAGLEFPALCRALCERALARRGTKGAGAAF